MKAIHSRRERWAERVALLQMGMPPKVDWPRNLRTNKENCIKWAFAKPQWYFAVMQHQGEDGWGQVSSHFNRRKYAKRELRMFRQDPGRFGLKGSRLRVGRVFVSEEDQQEYLYDAASCGL